MTTYNNSLTRPGGLIGTPEYMAPEQLTCGGVDGRSDIFSLALVGLEALTGVSRRRNASLYEVLSCTSATWTEGLQFINSGSPELDRHFSKALQWKSEDRPASAMLWAERAYSLLLCLPVRPGWVLSPSAEM